MELLDGQWVTDGGIETDLVFNHGIDLPDFAAFPLVENVDSANVLRRYYADYAEIASQVGAGLLLETPTWRANRDWGARLGYDAVSLDRVNRAAVDLVRSVLDEAEVPATRLSGNIGPRGDGYRAAGADPDEAAEYHAPQVATLAAAGVDLVHAMTLSEPAEAIGVIRAARAAGIPVAVSFTVETDGRLPDGSSLDDALRAVDRLAPADYYGINCAHPVHVLAGSGGGAALDRITFFRPNASTASHAELDEMEVLDAGDLALLTRSTRDLLVRAPGIAVLGGCCGTDSRHVAALWADAGAR